MTRNEKLKRRLLLLPKDFTFEELESLLFQLGFERDNKGKTSGSLILKVLSKKKL